MRALIATIAFCSIVLGQAQCYPLTRPSRSEPHTPSQMVHGTPWENIAIFRVSPSEEQSRPIKRLPSNIDRNTERVSGCGLRWPNCEFCSNRATVINSPERKITRKWRRESFGVIDSPIIYCISGSYVCQMWSDVIFFYLFQTCITNLNSVFSNANNIKIDNQSRPQLSLSNGLVNLHCIKLPTHYFGLSLKRRYGVVSFSESSQGVRVLLTSSRPRISNLPSRKASNDEGSKSERPGDNGKNFRPLNELALMGGLGVLVIGAGFMVLASWSLFFWSERRYGFAVIGFGFCLSLCCIVIGTFLIAEMA